MNDVAGHYLAVKGRLKNAAAAAGRPQDGVRLIAVSKTFPETAIREAYAAGCRDFGENYILEWFGKTEALADLSDIVWHVIGDVQSNKTKYAAERAHWLHTLSRLKTAERISVQRPSDMPPLQVCIEVNVSGEAAKHGVPPEDALPLALAAGKLPNIEVRGVMCVASANADEAELRRQFGTAAAVLQQFQTAGLNADTLSMGMSGDMETAVACGATMVRIGSAIFGGRDYGKAV